MFGNLKCFCTYVRNKKSFFFLNENLPWIFRYPRVDQIHSSWGTSKLLHTVEPYNWRRCHVDRLTLRWTVDESVFLAKRVQKRESLSPVSRDGTDPVARIRIGSDTCYKNGGRMAKIGIGLGLIIHLLQCIIRAFYSFINWNIGHINITMLCDSSLDLAKVMPPPHGNESKILIRSSAQTVTPHLSHLCLTLSLHHDP